jgi:hypothetical protein
MKILKNNHSEEPDLSLACQELLYYHHLVENELAEPSHTMSHLCPYTLFTSIVLRFIYHVACRQRKLNLVRGKPFKSRAKSESGFLGPAV